MQFNWLVGMMCIRFEKSFHNPKLNQSRWKQEKNFDNSSPFNTTLRILKCGFMWLIPFNMKLLISRYIWQSFENPCKWFFNIFDIFFINHLDQRIIFWIKIKTNVSRSWFSCYRNIESTYFIVMGKLSISCWFI